MADAVVQLRCGVKVKILSAVKFYQYMLTFIRDKNDSWGKKGKESVVAQLWSKSPNNAPIDDSKHYSEVTHILRSCPPGLYMSKMLITN